MFPLTTQQQLFFHKKGYAVLEGVIPPEVVDHLRSEADQFYQLASSSEQIVPSSTGGLRKTAGNREDESVCTRTDENDLVTRFGCIVGL